MTVSFENHLERVRVAARTLPEVDEVVSEGKPAFKVRGRLVARLEDETTLLLPCPIE